MNLSTRLLVVFVTLGAAAAALAAVERPDAAVPREVLAGFPMSLGEWSGIDAAPLDAATMRVLGVDDYVLRGYATPVAQVGLYIGYYRSQRQGDTIHSPMNCLPGAGWVPVEGGRTTIASPAGGVEVNRYLIQKGEDRQVALYWYQGRGRTVASEYWSKIFLVWDAARRNRTDGALVRVLSPVPYGADTTEADRRAAAFAADIFPLLARFVPE
jgi:EpsI family protein